jgi:RimJ/RimL family protein N-acetyltransferase
LDVRPDEHALEIGMTWLAPAAQRTGLNLEAKYLMLRHAFEDRKAQRVAFFTDEHNGRARASLVRLGATYEGTLRFHRMNGVRRNSAAYSILAPEWPQVRAGIEQRFLRARKNREPFRLSVLANRSVR